MVDSVKEGSPGSNQILPITIEEELKQSYLDYAMSVIVGRALPDVRDGLKPVHRRVLFAMEQLNNDWNKPYKKSARVVGDVIGKYHPHGDTAVYDAIVRMAQPFSMRYMLVDGQGNFGSVDGDAPAAMRYTEVRMSKMAHSLLADLDKETVDFVPNYDETEFAPSVLPSRIPNLLVNGSSGIAVGMATNIPPHNLTEVVNATVALIDEPDLSLEQIMQHVPGPDLPTAAIINGRGGILQAYKTGRGRLVMRARTEIENEGQPKQTIVIKELPYQVNKARLIEKIAELVKFKKIEGITALRDESDKDGMRVVIETRRGEDVNIVLNNLYSQTQMQTVFGMNMVALVDGRPKVLPLKDILEAFISHRREVVTRRTIFDLRKARERAHILEGLGVALVNIDAVVELIRGSSNAAEAKQKLLSQHWQLGSVAELLQRAGVDLCRPTDLPKQYGIHDELYHLSPEQAQAILDLRLHRLTGLEQEKIFDEYKELIKKIEDLLEILSKPERLMAVIREELIEVRDQFGDARRSEIIEAQDDLDIEDLIAPEDVVVTLSHQGYVKSQPTDTYTAQRRGGKGKSAASVKEEDFIDTVLVANTHDTCLCFSNFGKVYWMKVYKIPQSSRTSRGRPIVNLLPLSEGERIQAMMTVREYSETQFVFMATRMGTVKKVSLDQFSRPRSNGIIAVELLDGDRLIGVELTDGEQDVMLFSSAGKAIRFKEADVRAMGRTARGVRGIALKEGQSVISLITVKPDGDILTASVNGFGKRTEIDEFKSIGRGGQGVIAIQVTERNGDLIAAEQVWPGNEVLMISNKGTAVRTRVDEISRVGRNTQGVRLINLSGGEQLTGMHTISEAEMAVEDES